MKIRVLSDLHLEFSDHRYEHIWTKSPIDKETTILLAGDIDLGDLNQEFMIELCDHFKYVIRICGNHEFYGYNYDNVIRDWKEFELVGPKNFHFLHNDWRILDGVRFLGGTMWTSLDEADPLTVIQAQNVMSDYINIMNNNVVITPEFTIAEHDKFIKFLLEKFDEDFKGDTVVVTHHSPGNPLKRNGRFGDRLDNAYFANIEELIGYYNKAKLWVHGHTHQSWDYMINETRVVCNPYGYYNYATNSGFDKDLIIEI